MEKLLTLLVGILATMGIPRSVKLADDHPLNVRAQSCAADVWEVSKRAPESTRETWASILFVFAWKEGSCHANPPGFNDDGRACGVLQVHNPEKILAGATCHKVRSSRRLGLRVGLQLMMEKAEECGSIPSGLTAYAMYGSCPKNGWVLPLVRERLSLAHVVY